MPDSIIDPLSDGNANGSSRGSSLGLNSTGDNQEQQVVTGVPPPGQPATAGNGEQTGIPPALLVGGEGDEAPAGQSATEGIGATDHSPTDEDDGESATLSKKSSKGRSVGRSRRSSHGSSSDSSLTSGGSFSSSERAAARLLRRQIKHYDMKEQVELFQLYEKIQVKSKADPDFKAFLEEQSAQKQERTNLFHQGLNKVTTPTKPKLAAAAESPTGAADNAIKEDAGEKGAAAENESIFEQRRKEMAITTNLKNARRVPLTVKIPQLILGSGISSARTGVNFWTASMDAKPLMGAREDQLNGLFMDAASTTDPRILGLPRMQCLEIGKAIIAGTATDEAMATPVVRAVLALEAELNEQVMYQFIQALEASTDRTGGFRIVKDTAEGILAEVASKVPDVRFLHEVGKRLEYQFNATSGTSVESSLAAAEVFMTTTGAHPIQSGTYVEDITKKFSDIRSIRNRVHAANAEHAILGDAAAKRVQQSMPSDFHGIYISGMQNYEMLHGKSPTPPEDRAQRFLFYTKILAEHEARALRIASELDRMHHAHAEKRKTAAAATAAAQSKASSDKAARDKAAAEALAMAKQQSKAAGKQRLQANAATFAGCYFCSATDHTTDHCKFTSKVCAVCHSTDHLRRDCKKNGGAQAPAS